MSELKRLVLTRRRGESLYIGDGSDQVKITVNRARLLIEAPEHIRIVRSELVHPRPAEVPRPKDRGEAYAMAVYTVVREGRCSIRFLQRVLAICHSHAAELLGHMEEDGFVGPGDTPKDREVLLSVEDLEKLTAKYTDLQPPEVPA